MAAFELDRGPHPCVARRCGHEDGQHVRTPELAAPDETVLFCIGCARHEVRKARRPWFGRRPRVSPAGSIVPLPRD